MKICILEYKTRPVECVLLTLFTIVNTFMQNSYDGLLLYSITTIVTIFVPFAFILNAVSEKNIWFKRLYEIIMPISLICIAAGVDEKLATIHDSNVYKTTIGLLIIGVLTINNFKNDIDIIRNAMTMLWAIVRGCIGAFTAWVSLAIIVLGIETIFNTMIEAHLLSIPWTLFMPIIALALYDNTPRIDNIRNSIANNLLNFAITPAIIIFTLVLYVYIIKILVTWELPNGNIARITYIYYITAMISASLYRMAMVNIFDRFYHWLPIMALPIIILFWTAAFRRVYDYGLTEARVYMLMAGLVNMVFMYMLFTERSKAYKVTLIHLLGFLIILAFIPQTSATFIAENMRWNNVNKEEIENSVISQKETKIDKEEQIDQNIIVKEKKGNNILLINNCQYIITPEKSVILFPHAIINNESIILTINNDTIAETSKETLLRRIAHHNNMNYEQLLDSAANKFYHVAMDIQIDSLCVVFKEIVCTDFEQEAIVNAAYKQK